ncbi:MAG: cytochrome c-type biogenesis protein CcmH, partial [Rickettsiales bacterium]|nr:cytochrome c-type biogenesis protein CcmH [Rickettsiales bacterium]
AIKGEIVLLIKSLKDEDSEYDIEDFKGEIIDMFKDGKTSKDIIDFLVNKYGFKKKDIFDFVNGAKSDL